MIDLSPEKLADYNYLLGQFYIVDSNTEADAVQINAGDFLKQDLKITKETDTPQILIYHSHSQETFADSREGEESDTIVGVGDYLTQLLTENYGYQVVHLKEQLTWQAVNWTAALLMIMPAIIWNLIFRKTRISR